MPEPQEVYVCPSCGGRLPVEEAGDEDPVCRTDGCDREGEVLHRMFLCGACDTPFETEQELKQHAKDEHPELVE